MAWGRIVSDGMNGVRPLRLRAEDDTDLAVISTILQDALVAVGEMAFLAEEKRFALVANRFRWEQTEDALEHSFERTLTALSFEGVRGVRFRGFRRSEPERLLHILAMRLDGNTVTIEFSGESRLRLDVEGISCRLEDLGEPWHTPWRPRHPIEND